MRPAATLASASSPARGRETECERLGVALQEARGGHGGVWLVTGPHGIGKTYLLAWAGRRATALGMRVVSIACPRRSDAPFAVFESLRRTLEPHESAPAETPGSRLLGYVQLLLRSSSERPLAILLDDLQSADAETVRAFQILARALGGMGCLLVGSLLDADLSGEPRAEGNWPRVVSALEEEGTLHPLPLGGLDAGACRALVEEVARGPLALRDPGGFVSTLRARTLGNPLLLRELTLLLLSQRLLVVGPEGLGLGPAAHGHRQGGREAWEELPFPPSMRKLLLSRLDGLLPADLQLLRLAALVGSPFDAPALAGLSGRHRLDVEQTIAELAERGVLAPDPSSGALGRQRTAPTGWMFAFEVLGEVVLGDLSPAELHDLAHRAASWWAGQRPDEVETVARLFHLAREPVPGLRWTQDAIDRALSMGSTASAEQMFGWYFDLLALTRDPPEEQSRHALELIDRLLVRRLRRETVQILEAFARTQPSPAMAWETGWRIAHALLSYDVREAESRIQGLERTLDEGPREELSRRKGQLAFLRGELAGARGQWALAREESRRALALLGPQGTPWLRGRLLHEDAWAAMMQDRLAEAHRAIEEAQPLLASQDAPSLRSSFLVLEGSVCLMEGKLAEASRAYREASVRLLELGGLEGYGVALNNLAEVAVHAGELEEARAHLADAEVVALRLGYPRVRLGWETKWAWYHARRQEWTEVLRRTGAAQEVALRSELADELPEVELLRAWALAETDRAAEGWRVVEATERRGGLESVQPHVRPYWFLVRARLLAASGRPGVREALAQAVEAAHRLGAPSVLAFVQGEAARPPPPAA